MAMKDDPKRPPKAPAKGGKQANILLRFLAFLVTVALVVGAVALVVFREELNFDAIKRRFTYRALLRTDSGQAQPYSHLGGFNDVFVSLDGGLLCCSGAGIRLFSDSGAKYADKPVSLAAPAAAAAGAWSLAYDVGGQVLIVFRGKEEAFTLQLSDGKTLLSARINSSGYLAVISQESGYKGAVTVYNDQFQRLVQLNISSGFLTDAAVLSDNHTLMTAAIGQEGSTFQSELLFYSLDDFTEGEIPVPAAALSLDSDLALDLLERSGTLWALCENKLLAVTAAGELRGSYDFSDRYLKEFSLEGDGFAALLLGRYRAGTQADLAVVSADGSADILPISEQILSLSAAGRYIALLTADRLDIYTSDLTLYATLEGTQGARKVLMRADGSAILIDNDTARLYLPS